MTDQLATVILAEMAEIKAILAEIRAELWPKESPDQFMAELELAEASGVNIVDFLKNKEKERRNAEKKHKAGKTVKVKSHPRKRVSRRPSA